MKNHIVYGNWRTKSLFPLNYIVKHYFSPFRRANQISIIRARTISCMQFAGSIAL